VVAPQGLSVTEARDPGSACIRRMLQTETFEASLRLAEPDGTLSLHVGDGWVLARLPDLGGAAKWRGGSCCVELLAVPVEAPMGAGHFWYRAVDSEGLLVRSGIELGSEPVGRLPCGALFKVTCRTRTREGVVRLHTLEGWVSERATNFDFSPGALMAVPAEAPEGPSLAAYLVIAPHGAVVHVAPCPESLQVRKAARGTRVATYERRVALDRRPWLRVEDGWLCERAEAGDAVGSLQVAEVDASEEAGFFWFRVSARNGLAVSCDLEPHSRAVRIAAFGEVLKVVERRSIRLPAESGGPGASLCPAIAAARLRVEDGWVSERVVDMNGVPAELLLEPVATPATSGVEMHRSWHRVIAPGGLPVRSQPDPHSEPVRVVASGELVEVTERRKGSSWVCVAGGWAHCEELPCDGGRPGAALLGAAEAAPEGRGVFWYQVVAPF